MIRSRDRDHRGPSRVAATGVRAEEEAGEEDDGDDEDDARHDADPGGHRGEPAVAWRLDSCGTAVRMGGGAAVATGPVAGSEDGVASLMNPSMQAVPMRLS